MMMRRRKLEVTSRSVPRAGDGSKEALARRIMLRKERVGKSLRQIGLEAGFSSEYLRTSLRQQGMSTQGLARVALILRTTPEWLLRGEGPEEIELAPPLSSPPIVVDKPLGGPRKDGHVPALPHLTSTLLLRAVVAADSWIEKDAGPLPGQPTLIAADPRHPAEQFAIELRDNSLNGMGAQIGDLLAIAKIPPRSGDLVLFVRHRDGLIQCGVRRLVRRDVATELHSQSNNSRFAAPIVIADEGHMRAADGSTITFEGIVIGLYRSLA